MDQSWGAGLSKSQQFPKSLCSVNRGKKQSLGLQGYEQRLGSQVGEECGGQVANRQWGSPWDLMWDWQHWVTSLTLSLSEVAQGGREGVTGSSTSQQGSQCQTEGGAMVGPVHREAEKGDFSDQDPPLS